MIKLKAAAAPVNNFTPRKEKEKKKKKKRRRKKEKYSHLLRRPDWAVKVFPPKYYLK